MYLSPGTIVIFEREDKSLVTAEILRTTIGTKIGERSSLFVSTNELVFIEQVVKYFNQDKNQFEPYMGYRSPKEKPLEKSFKEWLSKCKSYEDIDDWFKKYFVYDHIRFKSSWSKEKSEIQFVHNRTPEETYNLSAGICQDVVRFIKYCLNKINPDYDAKVLTIEVNETAVHMLPVFKLKEQLYVLEYGSWAYEMHGFHGPFKDEKDIIYNYYLKMHPRHHEAQKYYWGWPNSNFFSKKSKEVKLTYIEQVKAWKSSKDVIEFLKNFKFDFSGIKDVVKCNPPLYTLEELYQNPKGTCSNFTYFGVKTLNLINRNYAAFGLFFTWRCKWTQTQRVLVWHENDLIYSCYFESLDEGTVFFEGPFKSYEQLHSRMEVIATESLLPKIVSIHHGVSILDVSVANDPRIRGALDFFGVDSGYNWYGKCLGWFR